MNKFFIILLFATLCSSALTATTYIDQPIRYEEQFRASCNICQDLKSVYVFSEPNSLFYPLLTTSVLLAIGSIFTSIRIRRKTRSSQV